MKKIALGTLLISALASFAFATDEVTPLVTHTELGYIQTDGNTNTETFNVDTDAKKAWGKHQGALHIDGQFGSAEDTITKKRYLIEATYDYAFTQRFAFNYVVGYKSDVFSGFAYQAYTGPGAKYKAIKSEAHNLDLGANILYEEDKKKDDTGIYQTDDYTAYKLEANYAWQILENLKFTQDLGMRGDFDNTDNYFVNSKTGLTTKISDIFSAGASYKIDYVNVPAAGKENRDTTLTFNLIMDY